MACLLGGGIVIADDQRQRNRQLILELVGIAVGITGNILDCGFADIDRENIADLQLPAFQNSIVGRINLADSPCLLFDQFSVVKVYPGGKIGIHTADKIHRAVCHAIRLADLRIGHFIPL